MTAEVKMFRNAQVHLDLDPDGALVLEMSDDHEKSHTFKKGSSVYSALQGLSWKDVENRFQNGNYFFANNRLIDFRTSEYTGYVATDEGIEILMDEIGTTTPRKIEVKSVVNPMKTDGIVLRGRSTGKDLEVPGVSEGGFFKTAISFAWNPFYAEIHSDSYLERLICTNGLVARSSIMQYRIPIINNWKENLDIATRRLQHKFQGLVVENLEDLMNHRASVGTVQLINKHIWSRLNSVHFDDPRHRRLGQLTRLTDVSTHCSDTYKFKVFNNQSIAKMLPSHLTAYDAYNIATEVASHTNSVTGSSDIALNKIASDILFDQSEKRSQASFVSTPKLSDFSNPDDAFLAVHEAF